MEWISCKEKLPEQSGSYFVTFNWGEIVRCTEKIQFHLTYPYYRWIWNGRDITPNVKAWMPSDPYMGD